MSREEAFRLRYLIILYRLALLPEKLQPAAASSKSTRRKKHTHTPTHSTFSPGKIPCVWRRIVPFLILLCTMPVIAARNGTISSSRHLSPLIMGLSGVAVLTPVRNLKATERDG